jgi:hypothetical protein
MDNATRAQIWTRTLAFLTMLVGLLFIFTGFLLCLTVIGAILGIPAIVFGVIFVGGGGRAAFGKLS